MDYMTPGAVTARRDYLKKWAAENPDKVKANASRYWERRAAKEYGKAYKGPKDGETMSAQAMETRRKYYRQRRADHPEENAANVRRYWERKAKEL